jgi:hypothetical protein
VRVPCALCLNAYLKNAGEEGYGRKQKVDEVRRQKGDEVRLALWANKQHERGAQSTEEESPTQCDREEEG